MADAVLSVVLERLAAIAEEKIRGEVSLVRGVKKEVLKLSEKLETVRNVLEDAERRGVKEKSVRGWLKKLNDTAYEMDDVLDEWNYYAIDAALKEKEKEKEKVRCSFIPSSCFCFKKVSVRRDIAKKIQNVKASLDEILKEKIDFSFVVSNVPENDSAPRVQSTSSVDLEKVEGLDVERNKNDLVGKLMNDGDRQIVSIVGMGGIGKTTLAQLVYIDSRIKDCFELRIWICVSDPFDVAGIASGIVENVEKVEPPSSNQLEVILQKLKDSISGKKFLLVLDDVWNEDYSQWEPLKINLDNGAIGSRILVTTRKEGVAKMMGTFDDDIYHPQLLTHEECWSLLRRTSFRGREERGEFEEVGKQLASKCKGLPLAVNVLGSVLQFKNSLEEWDNVLKSEIWELENMEVELFPHLLLSYNELSPPLKLCFSYCVVYPKDSRIDVESLIQQWKALGYLGSLVGNNEVELKGRNYFNNLAMRSLFHDFEKDESTKQIRSCKMHDIIHDFAQSLKKSARGDVSRMARRICQVCDPLLVSQSLNIRSLFWDGKSPLNLCDCLKSLRVFQYEDKWMDGINTLDDINSSSLRGMEKLIHLRLMDINNTLSKEDLKIICKFYFLQTLSLGGGCNLEEIPRGIGNLVHLTYLNLTGNDGLKELPESIGSLVKLQALLVSYCSLEEIPMEIGNLVQLRHLDLSYNANLMELPETMCSLVELHTLLLSNCSLKEIPREIGNAVQLRHLDLSHNANLKELPETMCSLVELQTLLLSNCSLKEIPSKIGNLVQLRYLNVSNNMELKDLQESIRGLVKLQTLDNRCCGNLKLPDGLANLSGIHSLPCFNGGTGYSKIGLLKNFNSLTGSLLLRISVSSSISKDLVEDAREAELSKKMHLQIIVITSRNESDEEECSSPPPSSSSLLADIIEECSSPPPSSSLLADVIEVLEPNHNLQFLKICYYMGSRLPDWISSPLNMVTEIQLLDCSEVISLPPLGKLPLLEKLYIQRMDGLFVLGVEWLGIRGVEGEVMDLQSSSLVAFPKLMELRFVDCIEWCVWLDITAEEEESSAVSVMPCLTELRIVNCDMEMLPHRLLHKASSLRLLHIDMSSKLKKCYGDKDGAPRKSICQNNPQLRVV